MRVNLFNAKGEFVMSKICSTQADIVAFLDLFESAAGYAAPRCIVEDSDGQAVDGARADESLAIGGGA